MYAPQCSHCHFPRFPRWDKALDPFCTAQLHLPRADRQDVADVGEEVVMLCLGHGLLQLLRPHEVAHQDTQAVHVGVLRSDDLKHCLKESGAVKMQQHKQGSELELTTSCLRPVVTKPLETLCSNSTAFPVSSPALPGLHQ